MPGLTQGNSIGSTVMNDLKSVAGNIAHAAIAFSGPPPAAATGTEETPVRGGGGGLPGGVGSLRGAAGGGALSKLKQGLQTAAAIPGDSLRAIYAAAAPGAAANVFQVQFNPQSLQLSARGGGRIAKTNYGAGGAKIEYGKLDAYIEFSVSLIFDAVNPHDAFLADKFHLSTTSVLKGAAAAGAGKAWSVQPQVEGFIGALRSAERRSQVTFSWGRLSYSGVLNGVSSRYTMFNPLGTPVRAEVGLRLLCTGDTALQYWNTRYAEVMKTGASGAVAATHLSNQLTNLFNL